MMVNGIYVDRQYVLTKKDECPTSAVITTINHDEVWFKRPDGSKSKLYISQLQKGKYSIKHS